MDSSNKIIHMFWIGKLNPTCFISINSFLDNNHDVYFWTYEENICNLLPQKVIIKNASEIVEKKIYDYWFENKNIDYRKDRYPTFANYFRYNLIYNYGGWWADLDTICLKPFDFIEEYVFSGHEFDHEHLEKVFGFRVINGVFKCPKNCEMLKDLCGYINSKKYIPEWGEWGPSLLSKYVEKHNLQKYKNKNNIFAPFAPGNKGISKQYIEQNVLIPDWAYALHMFNRTSMDLKGQPASLYDYFYKKYI